MATIPWGRPDTSTLTSSPEAPMTARTLSTWTGPGLALRLGSALPVHVCAAVLLLDPGAGERFGQGLGHGAAIAGLGLLLRGELGSHLGDLGVQWVQPPGDLPCDVLGAAGRDSD
ncbi:hypothetical protein ABZ656_25370 [Streptomyces sp. NPDC007095]